MDDWLLQDFNRLSEAALKEDKINQYLKKAKPREIVWYEKQKKLISDKFDDGIVIEPLPIRIFRRKNPRAIGRISYGNYIELHNRFGCTRHTLLHELTHAYLKARYPNKWRAHTKEFRALLKYLHHGGTVKQFYEKIERTADKEKEMRRTRQMPDYKLELVRKRIATWKTKLKRAENALRRLSRKEKYFLQRTSA